MARGDAVEGETEQAIQSLCYVCLDWVEIFFESKLAFESKESRPEVVGLDEDGSDVQPESWKAFAQETTQDGKPMENGDAEEVEIMRDVIFQAGLELLEGMDVHGGGAVVAAWL